MTYPAGGPTTVAALRTDHWTPLSPAPIAVRNAAVGAWTGTQMIIWGGSDGHRSYADGAAYDPAARVWTKLPAAPISARAGADYVWTGSVLFIWGSAADRTDSVAGGAVYDPATRRWTTVPTPQFSGLGPSAAVWTGSSVVLLNSPRAEPSGTGPDIVYAQSYNPARNAWTPLPTLKPPPDHGIAELSAVAVGGHVFSWAMWSHTTQYQNTSTTMAGVDAYQLDTGTRQWSRTLAPTGDSGVRGPLWTGREIVVPTLSTWCGNGCTGPQRLNAAGTRMDPRSSTSRPIPHGPVSDLTATYLWTGAVVLGVGANTGMGSAKPDNTAAWDPGTNAWTALPPAPMVGQDPVTLWTGTSLLLWGKLYVPAGTRSSTTTGLRLGP